MRQGERDRREDGTQEMEFLMKPLTQSVRYKERGDHPWPIDRHENS